MIYKKIFELEGTEEQIEIVKQALDKIKFPWYKLTPPYGKFIIGWADLNAKAQTMGKLHKGDHPGKDTNTEPTTGKLGGRNYTMGVMYPDSGNIYIDNYLVNYPAYAQSTVSAEIAHIVDFYLPITTEMKTELSILMHNGISEEHGHSWWEKKDYSAEYFSLEGESWMQLFTYAYSDMEFEASEFTHSITKDQAPKVREILMIERTDHVPFKEFKVLDNSDVYHKLSHHPHMPGKIINRTTGYKWCNYCKP